MLHRFQYETTPMLATLAVVLLLGFAPGAQAQDHVVLPADLHHEVLTASRARQHNLAKVQKFFGEEAVKKALKTTRIDPEKIQKAVPSLSDEELARLAAQTDKVQRDSAAGALNNTQITYIIIAIATALLVTLIFVA